MNGMMAPQQPHGAGVAKGAGEAKVDGARAYWNAIIQLWQKVQGAEAEAVEHAAQEVADAIVNGATLWAFGATHSSLLTGEMVYRAGGLAIVNPIYAPGLTVNEHPLPRTSVLEHLPGYAEVVLAGVPLRQGDVLFIFSTSGRNAVPVEMAIQGRRRGATVIAFTSRQYAMLLPPDDPPGRYLHDVADMVIDTHVPAGDAAVHLEQAQVLVGPVSTVIAALLVNGLVCRTAEILVARGVQPPVLVSGNLSGGLEANRHTLRAHQDRIHYT